MRKAPTGFVLEGLRIEVERDDSVVHVRWRGVSDTREPAAALVPFLTGLVEQCDGRAVMVDFSLFEFMNSATVAPILRFIKLLDGRGIETTVIYDSQIDWQRIQFQTMKVIARTLKHTRVESSAS